MSDPAPSQAVAGLGALVGDPHRAAMLLRLVEGEAAAADLAAVAGISPSLASAHLRRLLDGGLVGVQARGRRRFYRLASLEVAQLLESMQLLAAQGGPAPLGSLRGERGRRRLRRARLCYDHLAGVLGTGVTDALVAREALARRAGSLVAGPAAAAVLAEVDVDLDALVGARRPAVRECTDWTERRPHVSGGVGAAVADVVLERGWVLRRPTSRGLDVTADGAAGLRAWLGLDVAALEGWVASAS
ncbi:helix-turn-helix transcriptional regulator [Nocardioides marinquilinus]|uniref:Helix-turn-helix transcriptional regulator n=1 Tax=Nocardioides marinquilinus TaxID=1210400 RepID=A0ABP9PXA3_9ACTN